MAGLFIDSLCSIIGLLDAKNSDDSQYKILFVGYLDVIDTDETYRELIGGGFLDKLVKRDNTEKLLKIHGMNPNETSLVPTLDSLLNTLFSGRVTCDVIDFQEYEGSEIIVDLNEEMSEIFFEQYDIVFDAGSLEHVFDIALALKNLARAVKVGGYIYHSLPLTQLNHGFYNINPTLLYDFYEDNGYKSIYLNGGFVRVIDGKKIMTLFEIPTSDRFRVTEFGDVETFLVYIAERKQTVAQFIKPIQRKYRDKTQWV